MTKKTQLEAIVDIRKKLNEAIAPKAQKASKQKLTVRDLVKAILDNNIDGHFNFNDYLGRKSADDYDGSGAEIIYWHLILPGNSKWTFSVNEDEYSDVDVHKELAELSEDVLNLSLDMNLDTSAILDANGVILRHLFR
jgi:hypothetical protein